MRYILSLVFGFTLALAHHLANGQCTQVITSDRPMVDSTFQLCDSTDVIHLHAELSGCSETCQGNTHVFLWFRNDVLLNYTDTSDLYITSPGTYALRSVWYNQSSEYCTTQLADFFEVTAYQQELDTMICANSLFALEIEDSHPESIQWSSITGETVTFPTSIELSSEFVATGNNWFGCPIVDTLFVAAPNAGAIPDSAQFCAGYDWVIESVANAYYEHPFSTVWEFSADAQNWSEAGNEQDFNPGSAFTETIGYFRRNISVTDEAFSCHSNTSYFEILGSVLQAGDDQIICSGEPLQLQASGCQNYIWQNGADTIVTEDVTITDTLFDDAAFTVIGTNLFNINSDTLFCDYMDTILVTVVNVNAGEILGGEVLCYGAPLPEIESIIAPSGDGQVSFSWVQSPDPNNVSWSEIPGAVTVSYSPNTIATTDIYYARIVQATLNETICQDTSSVCNIHVLGDSLVEVVGGEDITLCAGEPIALNPQGCETYSWTNNLTTGDIPNEDLLLVVTGSNGYVWEDVSYACSDTDTLSLEVIQIAGGEVGDNQVLCAGEILDPFSSTTDAFADGNYQIGWQVSSDGISWLDIDSANEQGLAYGLPISNNQSFRRIVTTQINQVQCTAYSNILFVSVPNNEIDMDGPAGEVCRNSSYVLLTTNAEECAFEWMVDGGEVMSLANGGSSAYIHIGDEDSCVVSVTADHLLSGCIQHVSFTVFTSASIAPDTVDVFILDQSSHLLAFNSTQANASYSWGYSALNGTEMADHLSVTNYCYYDELDVTNYIYWVDVTTADGCTTRSFLNFENQAISISESTDHLKLFIGSNPFQNETIVSNPTRHVMQVTVFDAMGRMIENCFIPEFQSMHIGSRWGSGIHFIQSTDENGITTIYRAIKL